ncbi:hypothetical protein HS088_TW07G00158 [Tripterygium wilfordii]|uniref:Pentatricopeptide repeat-containing protein n=1 Tax=Tripterygium wilfordii TaxID=458696 RepID=A0A7J7DE36_TRIWF|nr:pentatricopeptide repeat-containing protein At5g59600 [Tripterygium wilfordii]KAF5744583.1 hypothetical protein HS088_TW07G00158 [Tripterygium wilfordii]
MPPLIKFSTSVVPQLRITIIYRSFQSSTDDYAELIQTYICDRALHKGKALHAHLIINGLAKSYFLAAKLLTFYTECKQLSNAQKLFEEIPETNIRRWVVLIGAYARRGYYEEAMNGFSEMLKEGHKPNKFVVPSILKACGHVSDKRTGEKLHCAILKQSVECDAFVTSALIDMYSKWGLVEKARQVFDGMGENDLVAMNAMVSGYAHHGHAKEALALVEVSQDMGLKPNVVTWNTLITGFSQQGDKEMFSKLFELMSISGVEPDVVSWTSVISGLVQNFQNGKAFDAFKQMLGLGYFPTSATISSLLPASAIEANVRRGVEIHGYAVVSGVYDDIYVSSALVDMYAKCGFICEARMLFYQMSERNTVTWNSMIFGYANHGHCEEAIELFNQMEIQEEKKLNHLSFTAVLTGCAHAGMIELGQILFNKMQQKYGIIPRLEHYACMVDLLGRAGRLSEAYEWIKTMPIEPDLFVWGALLGACRNHGNIDLAEIAAKHLQELEPSNKGNKMLLSKVYADAGSWNDVTRYKKMMKRKKKNKFSGCSWIGAI